MDAIEHKPYAVLVRVYKHYFIPVRDSGEQAVFKTRQEAILAADWYRDRPSEDSKKSKRYDEVKVVSIPV